jgi:hypothetical protein
MQKWQYQLVVQNTAKQPSELEQTLNSLGNGGWELALGYVNAAGENVFIFKKSA